MTDAREAVLQLRLAEDMVEQFGRTVGSIWKYLYLWGLLAIGACAVSQVLLVRGRYEAIPLVWLFEVVVGSAATLFIRRREVRRHRIVTPIDRASISACAALGISTGVLLVLLLLGVPIWIALPFMLSALVVFAIGAITDWWECYASAVVWWAGGILGLIRPLDSFLLMIPLLLLGTLAPAFLLERRLRRVGSPGAPREGEGRPRRQRFPVSDTAALRHGLDEARTSVGRFWMCLALTGILGAGVEVVVYCFILTGRPADALLARAALYTSNVALVLLFSTACPPPEERLSARRLPPKSPSTPGSPSPSPASC